MIQIQIQRLSATVLHGPCRRLLSSSSTSSSTPIIMANVLQGPSLVHTTLHRSSPSMMFLPGLRSLPFWTSDGRVAYQDPTVSHIVQYLEESASAITKEYKTKQNQVFSDYDITSRGGEHALESLHTGKWDWHSYMLKGNVQGHFVQHFPTTATILQTLRNQGHLFEGTPFGFSFLSKLYGKATIQSHTSPINFRLRVHVPLIVPKEGDVGIRVGPVVQKWKEGKAMVLDDSYNHEVWNHSHQERVLLLVDIWHPDVTLIEREQIVTMFAHAQEQGWLGNNPAK